MNKQNRNRVILLGSILGVLVFICIVSVFFQPYKIGQEYRGLKDYSEENGTQMISFTINDFKISVDTYQDGATYNTAWLSSEQATNITIGTFSGCKMQINGIPVQSGGTVSLQLNALRKDNNITVELQDTRTDWKHKFYIRTLPDTFPEFDVPTSRPNAGGNLCFALDNYLVKMDHKGNVLYYRASNGASDFRQIKQNGKTRYTFMEATGKVLVQSPELPAYKAVVLDEHYNVIDIVSADTDGRGLCQYGFVYVDDGHYIVASAKGQTQSSLPKTVAHNTLGVRVVCNYIQEIEKGKRLWQWDSASDTTLFAYSAAGNDYYNQNTLYADYVHLNDLELDPTDGSVICSLQNQNALLKLNRKNGIRVWLLGGKGDNFGLADIQKFYKQAQFSVRPNGFIDIFASNKSGQSKAFIYNPKNSIITEKFIGQHQKSKLYGSVCTNNAGKYIISWGISETPGMLLTEINESTGLTSFELLKVDPGANYYIDRAYPAD